MKLGKDETHSFHTENITRLQQVETQALWRMFITFVSYYCLFNTWSEISKHWGAKYVWKLEDGILQLCFDFYNGYNSYHAIFSSENLKDISRKNVIFARTRQLLDN